MARKFVRLASPIKKMIKGIGVLATSGSIPVPYGDLIPQATPPSYREGRFYYDDVSKTFNLLVDIDGVTANIPEESWVRGTNGIGFGSLTNGKVVYQSGASSNKPVFRYAKADSTTTSIATIAVMTHTTDAANNSVAIATTAGVVHDMDLSAFVDGDDVYLSVLSAGDLQATLPDVNAGEKVVRIGTVLNAHPTTGELLVNIQIMQDLTGLLPRSAWNGTFSESFNCIPSSDGATITASLEKEGGGDLTMQFSDGLTTLDCTPACTATLTAGSATVYQKNYIYIPIATKLLTVSTTGWPVTEHIKVSFQCVFTAAVVQTEDAFIHQDWNDELSDPVGMGHITHIGQILREGQGWFSGVDGAGTTGYLTIGAGTATVQTTAGVIKQVHTHTYIAKDTATGDDIHVVNDPTTPYVEITDLTNLTQDSTGGSLNNKYFNVVLAGTSNKSGQYSPLLLLLPSGTYNGSTNAERDIDGYTSTALPREFNKDSSNGFLIARLTLRLSGGNITLVATEDLRGVDSGSGGAGNAAVTEFPDSTFRVQNTADPTKEIDLDASGITTGTTRTITMPDKDVDLDVFTGSLSGYDETGTAITVAAGAGSFAWDTSGNIRSIPTLTQNTVITITGTLTALKPVTLSTIPDTGGPWTLSYIANGKTKLLTRNGSGTADLETFELWSDGVDVFTIEAGGTIWSKGA